MKIIAAEFQKFMKDDNYWEGYFFDEFVMRITEKGRPSYQVNSEVNFIDFFELPSDSLVDIEYGYVVSEKTGLHTDLNDFLKIWENSQIMSTIIIEVPKKKLESVKEAIEYMGCNIL